MKDQEVSIVIDLNAKKRGTLNESFLVMFGSWAKSILKAMFGGKSIPAQIKGSPAQIRSFADALGGEKRYLEAWSEFGLDDPMTYKRKGELDKAVRQFTSKTGVPWPFK